MSPSRHSERQRWSWSSASRETWPDASTRAVAARCVRGVPPNVTEPATARLLVAALVALGVMTSSSRAAAQLTVLLRDDDGFGRGAESGIAEGLRDGLGGSVRRLEASLADLALAAGCEGDPRDSSCIVRMAAAANAQLVVVERVTNTDPGWRIELDLRRGSDGARLRSIHLECASTIDCGGDLAAALGEPEGGATHTVAAAPGRATEPTPVAATTPQAHPAPEPDAARSSRSEAAPSSIPVIPSVLFGSAVVLGIGAIVAGAIGGQAAHDAHDAGLVTRRDQVDRLVGLETSRDVSFGIGAALAGVGACLAIGGVLTMTMLAGGDAHAEPSVRVAGGTDGTSTMIALAGTF